MPKPIAKKYLRFTTSILFFTALFVSALFSPTHAQTLLERSTALLAAQNMASIEVANAKLKSAEANASIAGLPISVGTNAGYAWNHSDTAGANNDWYASASINFAGVFGEQERSRAMAFIHLERAKLNLLNARTRASKTALELWHSLRRNQASLETSRINLQLAELSDRATELRLQSGAANQSERDNATLALQNAKLELARSETRLQSSQALLAANLGINNTTASQSWTEIAATTNKNLEAREDVFEARAAVLGSELDLNQAQHALLPVAKASANVAGSAGAISFNLDSNLATGFGYNYPNSSASLGNSWGFNLGATWGFSSQALALPALQENLQASRAALAATLKNAETDVEAKRAAAIGSHASLNLAMQQLENAKQNFGRNKTRFESGLSGPIEVKRSELELNRAQESIASAQAELDLAIAALAEATATPMAEK